MTHVRLVRQQAVFGVVLGPIVVRQVGQGLAALSQLRERFNL